MNRFSIRALATVSAMLLAPLASAQDAGPASPAAQSRYDNRLARCNSGKLPAPAREACVRRAGLALDRARGGPPVKAPVETADGRAIVVAPVNAPPPSSGSETVTSPDGRATIVLPADGTAPR